MAKKEEEEDYEMDFLEEPPSDLICSICLMVLQDPVQIMGCGHRFCDSCFKKWKQSCVNNRITCPSDNLVVSQKKIFRDNAAKRRIDNLKVKCLYEKCYWIGTRQEFKNHLSKNCFKNFHVIVKELNSSKIKVLQHKINLERKEVEVKSLQDKLSQNKKELTNKIKEIKLLQNKTNVLRKERDKANQLNEEFEDLKIQMNVEFEDMLKLSRMMYDSLETQLNYKLCEIDTLEDDSIKKQNLIDKRENEIYNLNENLNYLETELSKSKKKIGELEKQKLVNEENGKHLTNIIRLLRSRVGECESELCEMDTKLEKRKIAYNQDKIALKDDLLNTQNINEQNFSLIRNLNIKIRMLNEDKEAKKRKNNLHLLPLGIFVTYAFYLGDFGTAFSLIVVYFWYIFMLNFVHNLIEKYFY